MCNKMINNIKETERERECKIYLYQDMCQEHVHILEDKDNYVYLTIINMYIQLIVVYLHSHMF